MTGFAACAALRSLVVLAAPNAFAAPRHDRGLVATEFSSLNYFKRFTRSAFEDAAAGLEFWEADLRRHTGAPPGGGGGGAAERMRARLSKLMGEGGERNS